MSLWAMLRQELGGCLDLFLPPACHFCHASLARGHSDAPICSDCRSRLPVLTACCQRCAKPFATLVTAGHLCESCLRVPPPFVKVYVLGSHDHPLREVIHRLKYRNQVGLAHVLGQLLTTCLPTGTAIWRPDLIIPVPLHRSRLKQRGYNQALEMARPIGKSLDRPIASRVLLRQRVTPPQQGLTLAERQANLQQAFACASPLAGQSVLLIDDVMTSGATVSECSRALLAAGVDEVRVAVVCRA